MRRSHSFKATVLAETQIYLQQFVVFLPALNAGSHQPFHNAGSIAVLPQIVFVIEDGK